MIQEQVFQNAYKQICAKVTPGAVVLLFKHSAIFLLISGFCTLFRKIFFDAVFYAKNFSQQGYLEITCCNASHKITITPKNEFNETLMNKGLQQDEK